MKETVGTDAVEVSKATALLKMYNLIKAGRVCVCNVNERYAFFEA